MHCKTATVAQLLTALNDDGLGLIRLLRITQVNPRDMLSFERAIVQKST